MPVNVDDAVDSVRDEAVTADLGDVVGSGFESSRGATEEAESLARP